MRNCAVGEPDIHHAAGWKLRQSNKMNAIERMLEKILAVIALWVLVE